MADMKMMPMPGTETEDWGLKHWGGEAEVKGKQMVEELGKLQDEGLAGGLPCPRCGHDRMEKRMVCNALSRRAKVYICPDCGMDEAIRDMAGQPPLPFTQWGMVMGFADEDGETHEEEIPEGGFSTREALKEFLDRHECSLRTDGVAKARKEGKTLVFLYCDQEAYGDRSYYFCKEDGKVYSDYFSIGD